MQRKKILSAMILAAFAGAAQAQVSVYGLIDMSYGKNEFAGDEKATVHSGGDSGNSQGNSTTRFGIKGSTDVGSGIKANFNLQSGGITSDGAVNGNFFNRQAWLGFSGGFGELRVGRQDSVPFQIMGNFDLNGQSNGVTSAYSGVGVWATGRQSRSVQYISPDLGGLKLQVGFQPEDASKATTDKSVASAAAIFSAAGFSAGLAFESKHADGGEAFKSAAASYDFKFLKLMAGYTDGATSMMGALGGSPAKVKGPSAGFTVPIGSWTVGAQMAKDTTNDKDGVTEVFVNTEMLKSTYFYIEAASSSSDVAAKDGLKSGAVGVIYVF